jgi:acyl-CoA synthetase (AMP-forming)/AMP-acid ligase II
VYITDRVWIAATSKVIDTEGWLDTGDVGCVDQEGFLYIKDRCMSLAALLDFSADLKSVKDIIIRGGENVSEFSNWYMFLGGLSTW